MKHVKVCFLWHMHQPYYTDPVAGSASMPWVRLHATKAYYDMAYLLEKFPTIRSTFNFTPSLLLQLQEIAAGKILDLFLEYAQQPAANLGLEEKAFLIRHFFSANWATMVRPYPRYHELLVKRGLEIRGEDLQRIARQFSTQDLLDLQVWHNLAWFGYGTVQQYPRLAALRQKNRGFTEDEKQEVLALQRIAIQEIVPRYRQLMERGQIELTTTPFFHPILPLVIDTDINRRARPDLPLPARFRAPDDAEAQLQEAVDFHTRTFGRPPTGLWPSEGSVCPELLPVVHRVGLRWLATDEGILARSLGMCDRPWHRHSALYQPYDVGEADQSLTMLFRDREISDAFGFVYHKTTSESAAEDVLRRLRSVINNAPQDQIIIAIILDGENPWEHYHDGGEQFLSLLYTALTNHALDQKEQIEVQASTVSDAITSMPSTQHLPCLHSGSWINSDYKIWIGHHEDNHGWDLLGHTRTRLLDAAKGLPPERARAAWQELYAAEGSDWFWWYGDDFDTDFKPEFDRLFRAHLRNVWFHMGLPPPDQLNEPICSRAFSTESEVVQQPLAFLTPTIDGIVTNFFEWHGAGSINTQPPLGAMWKADGLFTAIRFGWSLDEFALRFDPDEPSTKKQGLEIDITLQGPEATFRLTFPLTSPGPGEFLVSRQAKPDTWQEVGSYRSISYRTIFELTIPWKELCLAQGHAVQMSIIVREHGLEVGRYPRHHSAVFSVPGPEFEAGLWRV
jgi:alpha-amylase/alpha-mannosidase (GH57 family)